VVETEFDAIAEAEESTDSDGNVLDDADGSDDTDGVDIVLNEGVTVATLDTEGLLLEVVLPVSVAVPIFDKDDRGLCEFVVDCVGLIDGLLLTLDEPESVGDFVGDFVVDELPV